MCPQTPATDAETRAERPPGKGLFVILAIFLLVFGVALGTTLKRRSRIYAPPAKRLAYGPSDFPSLFAEDPLAGLVTRDPTRAFPVPPPPFSEGMFPCMECHRELKTDPKPRPLAMAHETVRLKHGDGVRWCFDCHQVDSRDRLRLADGSPVEFTESHRLCGQCHGTIYRDWKAGIHGRRTGFWDGPKRYMLCAHCHDPHAPRFKPLEPLPPPARPEHLQPGGRE